MILNNQQLSEWGEKGGISPFSPSHINPASIDLCWSGNARFSYFSGWSDMVQMESLKLARNGLYLLDTLEYVKVPLDCAGLLLLKTKMGRGGTFLGHVGWVDPGFEGTLTFQFNHLASPNRIITRGDRIVQLVLMRLELVATLNYADIGHYYGQNEPTAPH